MSARVFLAGFVWLVFMALAWGQSGGGAPAGGAAPVIRAGDTLRLVCMEEPSLNREYRVTSDGLILVDFLGAVQVAGLTEAQAAAKIKKQLEDEKILRTATIAVQLVQPGVRMVKFGGAVGLQAETPWRQGMSLADIVLLADVRPTTDLSRVRIKRAGGSEETVDHTKAVVGQVGPANPLVMAGDEVVFIARDGVAPTPGTQPGATPGTTPGTQGGGQPVAQPGSGSAVVSVQGAVVLSGDFGFTPGMTVREALVRSGGFLNQADAQRITLEREGSRRELRLPVDADFQLRPGDRLVVGERSRGVLTVTVEGSVNRPGRIELEEGMTLTDAIRAAGGFVEGARADRIQIFGTGNARPRTVNFEDIELGYTGDLVLRAGQTISVPGPRGGGSLARLERSPTVRAAAGAVALLLLAR